MMRVLIFLLLSFFAIGNSMAQGSGSESDISKIKEIIQISYVEGLQNEGDTIKINRGFHPEFEMLNYTKDGTLKKYSITEWKKRIVEQKSAGNMPRKSDARISVKFLSVDVTGNAASARFEFYVGEKLTFVDYMLLYKYGADWKIVCKTYHKF